jgi:hypothetical protein
MANGNSTAYEPRSGMTVEHFRAVQDVVKTQTVIAVVRNTNTASTPLIKQGCPGKPMSIKSNTDAVTGVVTAANHEETKIAYEAGFFVVDVDLVARREVFEGDKPVRQEMKLDHPFWKIAKGQIIDPKVKMPLVGDYDIHGVFDPKNPGQNIALVASNGERVSNIESPIVRRFRNAVNPLLDCDRMLHGAQDQYAGFRGGATVFLPDGSVRFLETEIDVQAFYKSIRRETMLGSYNEPIPVLSGLKRAAKGILANQDIMAMVGQLLGAGIQWLGDIGIQRNVANQLMTTYANAVAANLAQGNGVLVIIHMQEWEQEDFNGMRARSLLGVSIEGGPDQQTALRNWRSQPRLLQGPADGWRSFDQYAWIEPPR